MQCPKFVTLVEPRDFGFNEETAISNPFQQRHHGKDIRELVFNEFRHVRNLLDANEIPNHAFDSPQGVTVPDAIFPNNWMAVMPNKTIAVFPMQPYNRRAEINHSMLDWIATHFDIKSVVDLSAYTEHDMFLEGTGSMVFDHDNKIAYACISSRTNVELFEEFCHHFGYTPFSFEAVDANGIPVYHTNVMMSLGRRTAIVCFDAIPDLTERLMLVKMLEKTGKHIIEISLAQMKKFCGNIMLVENSFNKHLWLMSDTAYNAFTPDQINLLGEEGKIVHFKIPLIEMVGGGGIRCMLAGIHVPMKA